MCNPLGSTRSHVCHLELAYAVAVWVCAGGCTKAYVFPAAVCCTGVMFDSIISDPLTFQRYASSRSCSFFLVREWTKSSSSNTRTHYIYDWFVFLLTTHSYTSNAYTNRHTHTHTNINTHTHSLWWPTIHDQWGADNRSVWKAGLGDGGVFLWGGCVRATFWHTTHI